MHNIVVMGGARTPFGKFGGSLKDYTATELAVIASREAIARSGIPAAEIDHVVFGNVVQSGGESSYLARHVGLRCEVPVPVPAFIVNRLCGSGIQSIISGAYTLISGESEEVLVGGVESMSRAPHVVHGARWGIPFGKNPMEDSLFAALTDTYCGCPMAITAENLANLYQIDRTEADIVSYESHVKAAKAFDEGILQEEIVPIELQKKREVFEMTRDEGVRSNTTVEKLGKLKPVFLAEGQVTAGNASGITDGAAALVLVTESSAQKREQEPLGYIRDWSVKGVQPDIMGIGPVPAIRHLLQKTGLSLNDIDLFEINEAFATQYLAVEKDLGLPREKVNVHGGAIAIGHPLGATGTRLVLTLLYELKRKGLRYGIASACIGGGQGIAMLVESYQG